MSLQFHHHKFPLCFQFTLGKYENIKKKMVDIVRNQFLQYPGKTSNFWWLNIKIFRSFFSGYIFLILGKN